MISVVIPLYNKEKYIVETLNSVLLQTYTDIEVIVVNDGSTDSSLQRVEDFDDLRLKIISIPNSGVSNARNVGILSAKYDWIALLDSDDRWDCDYLANAINLIRADPDMKVIASNYYKVINDIKTIAFNRDSGYIDNYYNFTCMSSSSVIIFNDVFKDVELFSKTIKYGEDQHMWFRIASQYKIFYNSHPAVYYILDEHKKANANIYKRDIRNDLVYYILDLNLKAEGWRQFKYNYVLKYLRPYYLYDWNLEYVRAILNEIPTKYRFSFNYLFYIIYRPLVKKIYGYIFTLKYIKS